MGRYDSRTVTLDPGLTALALRALRDREGRYPFLDRHVRRRRRKPRGTPPAKGRATPRYLMVVSRNHPDLLKTLKRAFGGAAHLVEVISDRRSGDRRRGRPALPGSERRRGERRRRPPAAWKVFGLLLAPQRGPGKAGKPRARA